MIVKKYIAKSMPEVMKLVRNDLGSDAVILHSKTVYKGGFLGLFKKKNIEVIAGKELNNDDHWKDEKRRGLEKIEFKNVEKREEQMVSELKELKKMVAALNHRNVPNPVFLPKPFEKYFQQLMHQEIDLAVLQQYNQSILETFYQAKGQYSEKQAEKFSIDFFVNQLQMIPFGKIAMSKKYITLLGPTGVGKTTTLAKLAAYYVLQLKKQIAFITTDTYRIAAVDQLKTYATILDAPLEVCYTKEDFERAKKQFQHYDAVFVDTAGRNYRNKQFIDDLHSMISFTDEMETCLVFPLTAKEKDMEEIYQQFSSIPIDKFIFTKLDETTNYGSLFNIPFKYRKGVAYITNGQDVPDDLIEATPTWISKKILGVDEDE